MEKNARNLSTITVLLALVLLQAIPAVAQFDNIEDFIRAGKQDAEALTQAYLQPLGKGIGGSLNTGWVNSASTHHPLGFDVQVRGALAFIPDADQTFNVSNLDLQNLELAAGESPLSPTIGGEDEAGPEVILQDADGDEIDRFNLPQGTGFHFVPAPMVQASVGLIKSTDVILRFVPEVTISDYGSFNMKGLGIKHSLSQWIPGHKFFPLDISVMAGFNRIDMQANLELQPDPDAAPDPTYTGNYENQKVKTSFDTFTVKLLVGKDLPFISVYGGVGYETSTMNVKVVGDYPVTYEIAGTDAEQTETITDPFSYTQDGANAFSLTGGVKLKLLFFHIFGEYTVAKYPVANAGIGFSFR